MYSQPENGEHALLGEIHALQAGHQPSVLEIAHGTHSVQRQSGAYEQAGARRRDNPGLSIPRSGARHREHH